MTAAADQLQTGAGRSIDPRRRTFWLLSLPSAGALALFLILPLLFMIALSFRADLSGQLLAPFAPTLKQYAKIVATGSYWNLLAVSTVMKSNSAPRYPESGGRCSAPVPGRTDPVIS